MVEHLKYFQVAAEEAHWNEEAINVVFVNSLSEDLMDWLAICYERKSLNELINLAIQVNNWL